MIPSRVVVAWLALSSMLLASAARAEYAPGMEPGRLAVRHAAWLAAYECRAHWPRRAGRAVELEIRMSQTGFALSVTSAPAVPPFDRCVLRRLRRQRLLPTGVDRGARPWRVPTRYVIPGR